MKARNRQNSSAASRPASAANPNAPQSQRSAIAIVSGCLLVAALAALPLQAQQSQIQWTPRQATIVRQIESLRQLPDATRGRVTGQLALQIRQLPPSHNQVLLAVALASLSTEGDPGGHGTIQAVTTTLAGALRQTPIKPDAAIPAMPYLVLATLVHFERTSATLDSPEFAAALAELNRQDGVRARANFTLRDLRGHRWTLQRLRGKVVLVNFWATWCPPCRREMPDLGKLYLKFKDQGLFILGVVDDDTASNVRAFAAEHHIPYPVLLDPSGKVSQLFSIQGIPMSFLYNRQGQMVAEAPDMRTHQQFLAMLAKAGLH